MRTCVCVNIHIHECMCANTNMCMCVQMCVHEILLPPQECAILDWGSGCPGFLGPDDDALAIQIACTISDPKVDLFSALVDVAEGSAACCISPPTFRTCVALVALTSWSSIPTSHSHSVAISSYLDSAGVPEEEPVGWNASQPGWPGEGDLAIAAEVGGLGQEVLDEGGYADEDEDEDDELERVLECESSDGGEGVEFLGCARLRHDVEEAQNVLPGRFEVGVFLGCSHLSCLPFGMVPMNSNILATPPSLFLGLLMTPHTQLMKNVATLHLEVEVMDWKIRSSLGLSGQPISLRVAFHEDYLDHSNVSLLLHLMSLSVVCRCVVLRAKCVSMACASVYVLIPSHFQKVSNFVTRVHSFTSFALRKGIQYLVVLPCTHAVTLHQWHLSLMNCMGYAQAPTSHDIEAFQVGNANFFLGFQLQHLAADFLAATWPQNARSVTPFLFQY